MREQKSSANVFLVLLLLSVDLANILLNDLVIIF